MRALECLAGQPRALVTGAGILLVGLVAVLDCLTPWEVSLAILYLIPITLVVWGAGKWPGVLVSCASSVASLLIDVLSSPPYPHPAIPYWNSVVRLGFFLISALMLSSLKRALDREKELASTDPLTGIANARSYYERAFAEISRAKRYHRPFSVAYLDLDDFKVVNDRFGHGRGDWLLRRVAETIRAQLRRTDLLARLGGDEFALLLPETGYESAKVVIQKVRTALQDEVQTGRFPVTCSIGAVTFVRPPQSVDALIRRADALMYSVKRKGKNWVRHEAVGESQPSGPKRHRGVDTPKAQQRAAR
jgi:diguanylate cyclase (GGDEF)-like protein